MENMNLEKNKIKKSLDTIVSELDTAQTLNVVPDESPKEEIVQSSGKTYKLTRPAQVNFSEYRANTTKKIPNIVIPGYTVKWVSDLKVGYIEEEKLKGWQQLKEGIHDAEIVSIYGGKDNKTGKEYKLYAMYIPNEMSEQQRQSRYEHNTKILKDTVNSTIGSPVTGAKEYSAVTNAVSRGTLKVR